MVGSECIADTGTVGCTFKSGLDSIISSSGIVHNNVGKGPVRARSGYTSGVLRYIKPNT